MALVAPLVGEPRTVRKPAASATRARISPSGLRLTAGTLLGLGVTLRPSRTDEPAPFDATPPDSGWFSLFETHRLVVARLEEPGTN